MSHDPTRWPEHYKEKVSLRNFIGNIFQHTPIFEEIEAERPTKVLEIGAGTGTMGTFLSWLGYDVTEMDLDEQILKIAQSNHERFNGNPVKFIQGDAYQMPFEDDSFDLAYHQGFFEHFSPEEVSRLVAEQLRVAKKIVFSVPNVHYGRQDYGDEALRSKKEWEEILSGVTLEASYDYWPGKKGRVNRKVYETMYLGKIARG